MQAHTDLSSSSLEESNQISNFNVVSEFCINSSCFLVISLEECTEDSHELPSDTITKGIPFSALGHFKCDGHCYAVIKTQNPSDCIASSLTNILTERELQIVAVVASGLSNKQVASQLKISEWTVSAHLRRIFIKLHVDNRTAMIYRYTSQMWSKLIRR